MSDAMKNMFKKKSNQKKKHSAFLSSERFRVCTFGKLHILVQGAGMPLTMCCWQSSKLWRLPRWRLPAAPTVHTWKRKTKMSNVPRNGQMTNAHPRIHTPTWSCHVLIILIHAKVDPSKLKAWIKTGQRYSKLFKVSLAVPCSLMYRFLLQISDASQDMDRRGLFQMIWTWPRDLHFDGRQQRIIWCKDRLLVSEDGPMPWSSWEFVNKSKSIVANQSKSSSSNMFAISSSCYCVVWLIIQNCLEHAKLHIQNRQRHNLLLHTTGSSVFGGPNPHPEIPRNRGNKNGAKMWETNTPGLSI